eukprot:COSAG05_NODE_18_length_34957_cov_44.338115_11_plen_66_part_00
MLDAVDHKIGALEARGPPRQVDCVKWGGFIMDAPVITASSSFSDAPVITVSPARSSQGLEGFGTV